MTEVRTHAGSLALRRWTQADRAAWLALFADPDVVRWVGDGHVDRERDTAIFERLLALAIGPDQRFAFVMAAELCGEIAGHVELKLTEHTRPGEWELVYVLARRAWGRGLGSALAAWGLATAHAHGRRVIATVARNNTASLRILAKLGLATEAELYGGETLLLRERASAGARAPRC